MNKYIIVTPGIVNVGGLELFVAGKAEYLEKNGWEVSVLHGNYLEKKCAVPILSKYLNGGFLELRKPPYIFPKFLRNIILNKMISFVKCTSKEYNIVYIESHDDCTSQWAELLAERLNAKHIFFICNEKFRGKEKYYDTCMDFYLFKLKRKELVANMTSTMQKFFSSYFDIKPHECILYEINENPVREVDNEKVDNIKRCDYNICYIGRPEKAYVPNIMNGIKDFANLHRDRTVQIIKMGDIEPQKKLLEEIKSSNANIEVMELGPLVPIPKNLFNKVDVVIAGAGSADCAVHEGVPVIVAGVETKLSNGLLGYETKDTLFLPDSCKPKSFCESLIDVLDNKIHKKLKFDYPKKKDNEYCQRQNLELYSQTNLVNDYYPEEKICICEIELFCVLNIYGKKLERIFKYVC